MNLEAPSGWAAEYEIAIMSCAAAELWRRPVHYRERKMPKEY